MKIELLRIETPNSGVLFPSLIFTTGKIYLVDCGYEETFDLFQLELQKFGVEIADLEAVILSHDDIDHLGGLAKFKECCSSLKVFCGALEAEVIAGKIKSERLMQAENSLNHLLPENNAMAKVFIQSLIDIKRFEPDRLLTDGELLNNEILIIFTPGHTRGHISLYSPSTKTVIAGDALVIEDGLFNLANPLYTLDLGNAVRSIEKIYNLMPEQIICYHGGIIDKNVKEKLEEVISRYKGSS